MNSNSDSSFENVDEDKSAFSRAKQLGVPLFQQDMTKFQQKVSNLDMKVNKAFDYFSGNNNRHSPQQSHKNDTTVQSYTFSQNEDPFQDSKHQTLELSFSESNKENVRLSTLADEVNKPLEV